MEIFHLQCVNRNVIQVVSLKSGELQGIYRGHSDLITAMTATPEKNGKFRVVSASIDGQIDIWNPVSIFLLFWGQVNF